MLQIKSETVRADSGTVKMRTYLYEDGKLVTDCIMDLEDYIRMLQGSSSKIEKPTVVTFDHPPKGFYTGYKGTEKGTLGAIFVLKPQETSVCFGKDR